MDSSTGRRLLLAAAAATATLAASLAAPSAPAATVWTGPGIAYAQPGTDPTVPTNQDRLTSRVWITRAATAGIFNAVTETFYTKPTSPADTEWAVGPLSDWATLTYSTWESAGSGNPVLTLVGKDLVLHLITDDIYLSVRFTSLGGHGVGGFAYMRSTPAAANLPPSVTITNPSNAAQFLAPATFPVQADASDADGTVATVQFFANGSPIGSASAAPFAATASNLGAGAYALTAVATDNGGLSTTSAPVNVVVGLGNHAPSVTITNPIENASLSASANVNIQVTAADDDGSVTNVQFFDGAVSLGNDGTSPFSLSVRLAIGAHVLTAVATDNQGASTTSAEVHVTVARYLPAITNGDISILLVPVATGLAAPDYAIHPPGDSNRLFIVEQNGLLRILQNGVLLPGAALDLSGLISTSLTPANANDERGFLGLAFHPDFNEPGRPGYATLYTFNSQIPTAPPTYAAPNNATQGYVTAINEWKISSTNANVVDPDSRREIISFGKNANNHNGGTIAFGPDGYLYLALGDGGNANDVGPSHIEPTGNAQNLSTPLGKMIRIDPLNPALNAASANPVSANGQYRIPTTNPFQGEGQVPEIYALGFRNPYRFAFDRVTGDLIEADVGQNNIEEINRVILGGNYGWAIKEGDFFFNRTNGPAGAAGTIGAPPGNRSPGLPGGLIDPISGPLGTLEYDHNDGISITGGFVYRGSAIPELYGKYIFGDLALRNLPPRADGRLFYADLTQGTIHEFRLPQFSTTYLPNGLTVHGFGQDAAGELYALVTNTSANGAGGIVYQIAPVRVSIRVTESGLDIAWPTTVGHLEMQVDGLTPGNWTPVPGSTATNRLTVPIDPANHSVFFRLAIP